MKKILFLIILMLCIMHIFANAINEYPQLLIYEMRTGNKPGELGDTTAFINMGGVPLNPFTINSKGYIYVCDFMNQRINIYDLDFKFIKQINDNRKSYLFGSYVIKIDETENIIGLTSNGLIKINPEGEEIFRIQINDLPKEVNNSHIFFILDDCILYYDDDLINIINQNGKKLNQNELKNKLDNFNSLSNEQDTMEIDLQKNEELKNTIEKNKIVTYKEKIITKNFQDLKDFNSSYKKIIKDKNISGSKKTNFENILNELTHIKNIKLIGYDSEGNSYWRSFTKNKEKNKHVVLVCSKNGEIIDCFYNELSLPNIAIAPNGDVYFMDRTPRDGKFLFYKVERRW